MRGKLHSPYISPPRVRITPADAGKTHKLPRIHAVEEDHPRGCGENRLYQALFAAVVGSPPRMRGKPFPPNSGRQEHRITPAGAGKTMAFLIAKVNVQDHPRRCGENAVKTANTGTHVGSPPQVRGKRCGRVQEFQSARITPAGAGKTSGSSSVGVSA